MKPAERKGQSIGHLHGAACLSFCLFFTAGCIREQGLEDCPTGLIATFYSESPCGDELTLPDSTDLHLFLFDGNDRFVGRQVREGAPIGEAGFQDRLELAPGTYSVIAWAGLETGPYDLESPVEGVTTREDLLFRLHRSVADVADSSFGARVWYGQSPAVEILDPGKGSWFAETAIDLLEVTNRVTVEVSGVAAIDDLEVILESDNGSVNFDNTLAPDNQLRHTGIRSFDRDVLAYRFTTLDLAEGLNSTLTIEENGGDTILYHGDLLSTLIARNPEIELACQNDFSLLFNVAGDHDTYMITEIWVDDWLVYSYEADL